MPLRKGGNRSPLLLFLSLLCLETVLASPTKSLGHQSHSIQPREFLPDGTLNCETERSSDYYGLGVRLGIYFAWFQAWIANVCVPSEISSAQDTNAVFLFAILVSMVKCTTTHLLLQLDGLMLMHLGGGTIFSVLSIWGYRTCTFDIEGPTEGIRKFGGWGTHLRLLVCMGISTFGLFFWAWGLQGKLDPDTDPGCEVVYTFMFSKVRADGGIRVFYIFICISCMLYFGTMLLVSLVAVPTRVRRWTAARKEGDAGERTRHKFATGLSQKQLRHVFYFLRIGNFFFIVYSMVLIEMSLNYNNVAGVLGWRGHIFFPSQIIPMIIGIFGFCRVIWVRYQQWKAPDYSHPSTHRTILKPKAKELAKMYTPKSNVSLEVANDRNENEIDPLMKGQPTWLRLLVSWLPWLGVLRWWKPGSDDEEQSQDRANESSTLMNRRAWSSSESTPKFGSPEQRGTWGSDDTARTSTELPQIPRNLAKFGSLTV